MLTVFRILFGKNVKIGNVLAVKGSSLSFFKLYNHTKTVIGALPQWQINDNTMI
ncbi:hypothetical protein [Lysinibacillus sphaericus]|uniref:hypothetical protein n=1 Tax=Lysinibacillus sphaericus TaxID=1421 RepID=UPI00163BB041|nr:hypothetical protein [Lysinibacillus sp. SDF0037]